MSSECEKALVGSIQKFSIEDGPGIRTTVFLKGCPLNCQWCHNPEMIRQEQELIKSPNNCIGCGHCVEVCPQGAIKMNPETGIEINRTICNMCLKCADECYAHAIRPVAKEMSVDEIIESVIEDIDFYNNTGGGMTVSGGEILMHASFVSEVIDRAAEASVNVCVDTSGYGDSRALMEMATKENVTNILYDMKSIDDEVHKEYTGVSNEIIIKNLRMLAADERTRDKIIMRMPLMKGVNDTEDIIKRTGALYKELGIKIVNLLPYHNLGISKMKNIGGVQKEFQPPEEERLNEIEIYFKNEINLRVEILGRI